ncbi:MAG TPA: RtcB family protein [Patescibacteria group bacterium]|nr:MAG: hypothetical protein UR43_C0005G0021 [candidate division TM6 bacterium GW2011_GWF2_33_332]HLD91146.1 RtcB family protein [Patescibacteria group bacterium]
MKYIDTENVIIKSWCNEPEESTIEQAKNLANLPFVFRQVCLMPDTHMGHGMPIGGVLATKGVVIPNAVGVDIGCGMYCVKTSLKVNEIDTETIKKIMTIIRKKVPVGFAHHQKEQPLQYIPKIDNNLFFTHELYIINNEFSSAMKQVGTLGGGNHFIEIQKGSDGYVYFMIHTGSRNLGKKVCDYYNKIARDINDKWFSKVPKEWDLAFLPLDTREAKLYINEMTFCLEFAFLNRKLIAERIKESFLDVISCSFTDEINIHHNYAAIEHHFDSNVVVHRKGATSARDGELGLIPGSQGTSSYIVRGKGNVESFMSCSHGAGRKLSRTKARNELNLENEQKILNDKGIIHSIRNQEDLDEASNAYKDIDIVMEEQKDLVDILIKLEPMGVIKG